MCTLLCWNLEMGKDTRSASIVGAKSLIYKGYRETKKESCVPGKLIFGRDEFTTNSTAKNSQQFRSPNESDRSFDRPSDYSWGTTASGNLNRMGSRPCVTDFKK